MIVHLPGGLNSASETNIPLQSELDRLQDKLSDVEDCVIEMRARLDNLQGDDLE